MFVWRFQRRTRDQNFSVKSVFFQKLFFSSLLFENIQFSYSFKLTCGGADMLVSSHSQLCTKTTSYYLRTGYCTGHM